MQFELKPTPCEECDHVHPATIKYEPRRWQCLKFPRLPNLDAVAPTQRVIAEPYNLCIKVNLGHCPVWEPRREAPVDQPSQNASSGIPVPDAQGAGASAPQSTPAPAPDPEPMSMEDFERVVGEIRDHLSTTRTEQDIADVLAMFNDDYNLMTRSQRSVVDGDAIVAQQRVKAIADEESRQRVESGGGKGIREYMDEDRKDAEQAVLIDKDLLFDPALANGIEHTTDGDEKLCKRLRLAVEATKTPEDADRLYALMKQTGPRRKAIQSETMRDEIYMLARTKLDSFN